MGCIRMIQLLRWRVAVVVNRVRCGMRRPFRSTPYLWDVAMWAGPKRRRQIARPDSALVIEGYPRSGNTYLQSAFLLANGFGQHVACHRHAPAQVFRALRLDRPTVITIRQPADATLSYVIRWTDLSLAHALEDYIDFYRAVWPVRDRVVICLFDDIVRDAGSVIDQVNARFGTSYARYVKSSENETAVRAWIDDRYRTMRNGQLVEAEVSRPSEERRRRKTDIEHLLRDPDTASRLKAAGELYECYRAVAIERAGS